jgi:hypothetical protein
VIEFQLDGGGFGTFADDTTTTVTAKPVEKSDYEKNLERQIAATDDPDKKRGLQRDLDRERARRERQDAANQSAARIASQIKAKQVADNRLRGGSRFNLRWAGSIPEDQITPQAVMERLSEYVVFNKTQTGALTSPAQNAVAVTEAAPSSESSGSPTAHLQRGMKMDDVTRLLGEGRQLSQSVSNDGLKTQIVEYLTDDRRVEVTYVEGLVVRFSIASR